VQPEVEKVEENDIGFGYCNTPFTMKTMAHDLPTNFHFACPLVDYDGSAYPAQHIETFEQSMTF
jgi:hypothetical protein